MTAWGNLAITLSNLGRDEEALRAIDQALGYLGRLEDQGGQYEAWLSLVRAEVFEGRGELDEAERAYARALEAFSGDEEMTRAEILAGQARLLVRRGRAAEALSLARGAAKIAREHPGLYTGLFVELALAQALWATGEDREGALEIARKVLAALQGPEDGFRRGQVEAWLEGKDARRDGP